MAVCSSCYNLAVLLSALVTYLCLSRVLAWEKQVLTAICGIVLLYDHTMSGQAFKHAVVCFF